MRNILYWSFYWSFVPIRYDFAKMQLYILQDGKPTGPFDEAELISRWKKGTVRDTDLVWTEWQNEWAPLAKLLSVSNSNPVAPRNDESHWEKKTNPNSLKWYRRWQTWAVATVTLFLLLLFINTPSPPQKQSLVQRVSPIPISSTQWNSSALNSASHFAAWHKGYEVGKRHRANGEPLPSLTKLYSMGAIEGDGFYEGYLEGFRNGGN